MATLSLTRRFARNSTRKGRSLPAITGDVHFPGLHNSQHAPAVPARGVFDSNAHSEDRPLSKLREQGRDRVKDGDHGPGDVEPVSGGHTALSTRSGQSSGMPATVT